MFIYSRCLNNASAQAVQPRLLAAFGAGACRELAAAWSGGWAQLLQVQPALRQLFVT